MPPIPSLGTVLHLAIEVTQLSHTSCRDTRNAPHTYKQYLRELASLTEVLFRLEQSPQGTEMPGVLPPQPTPPNGDAVIDCYQALSTLYLEQQQQISRLRPPLQDTEVKARVERLQKPRAVLADLISPCIQLAGNATEQDRKLLLSLVPNPKTPVRERPSSCPDIGEWLWRNKEIQEWVNKPDPALWCYGPPGVRESLLASSLINQLLENESPPNTCVIHYFCRFTTQKRDITLDIFHHLLRQLIRQGNETVLAAIQNACKDPLKLHGIQQLCGIIASVSEFQPIYLILDAADQLGEPDTILTHMRELATSGVHVLVTSRDAPTIRSQMESSSHLQIRADIFQNQGLSAYRTYEATIQQIESQSQPTRSTAIRLLGWIVYAKRPLELEEVLCAFAVGDGQQRDNGEIPTADTLLQSCFGLVMEDQTDHTLRIVNSSTYDALQNRIVSEKETNLDMAKTSCRYLINHLVPGPCNSAAELLERFRNLPFLDYAAQFWGRHIRDADSEYQLKDDITELLGNNDLRNAAFQALHFQRGSMCDVVIETMPDLIEDLFRLLPSSQNALHIAAYWGLTGTMKKLLVDGANPSPLDAQKWSPLHWASSRGQLAAAKLLVNHSADLDAQDVHGWSPLFWPAFLGKRKSVQLLLSAGANLFVRSTLGWTSLHWAILGGHVEVVKRLLQHHSHFKLQDPSLLTMDMQSIVSYAAASLPVDLAAEGGDAEIFSLVVRYLQTPRGQIQGDAGFNMIWPSKGSGRFRSMNPWRPVTKSESLQGLDGRIPRFTGTYPSRSDLYRSSSTEWKSVLLLCAIRDQRLSTVQLLADAGADVNYRNALHVAAWRRDPSYVRCLLAHGARTDTCDGGGRTALHEAILNGHVETAAALIDGGSDVNQPIEQDCWEREMSISSGYSHIYPRLKGASTLMQACGLILFHASQAEVTFELVRLLLSRGADFRMRDDSGMTVLHYTLLRPYSPVIRLLLDAGCPADIEDADGRLPLHYLARCKDDQVDSGALREVLSLVLRQMEANGIRNPIDHPAGQPAQTFDEENTPRQLMYKRLRLGTSGYTTESRATKDKGYSAVALALENGGWKIARVLFESGAHMSPALDMGVLLDEVIRALDPQATAFLLDKASLNEDAVVKLMRAFIKRLSDWKPNPPYLDFHSILRQIVGAGADVNFSSSPGTMDTPLTIAAKSMFHEDILHDLLNLGADVYSPSAETFDPILTAAVYRNLQDVRFLLDHAAEHPNPQHWSRYLEEISDDSRHPLMRICQCLQEADVLNQTNLRGKTLLHLAAERGNVPLLASLMYCGARTDIQDDNGQLAIHAAGFEQAASAVQTIISLNTEPFYPPESSLGETTIRELLTTYRKQDKTMFRCAVEKDNMVMIEYLLHSGVDPNSPIRMRDCEAPALSYAIEQDRGDLVSLLLGFGANIEAQDQYGWRPLHFACFNGRDELAVTLIEAGCNIHAVTRQWNNSLKKPSGIYCAQDFAGQPLHLAAMSGRAAIVQLLLEKGVDVHARTGLTPEFYNPGHGPTALHIALDTGTFYYRIGHPLDEGRLCIAQSLVDRGVMARGILDRFSLEEILKFKDFSSLWDALVAAQMEGDNPTSVEATS